MKNNCIYLLVFMTSIVALNCSVSGKQEPQKTPVGEYQYTGFNSKGDRIIEGRISITSVESKRIGSNTVTQVKGNWQLNQVKSEERIGAQTGTGELIGTVNGDELNINLNPGVADANVYLEGKLEGNKFTGQWRAVGYAGTVNQGRFEALRK